MHVKLPAVYQYFFKVEDFHCVLRSITGADLFEAAELVIDTQSAEFSVWLFNRLLIKQNQKVEELDLIVYQELLKEIFEVLIKKTWLTPRDWLKMIFIVSGKKFESNWRDWETQPVELLIALYEVAKELQSPSL